MWAIFSIVQYENITTPCKNRHVTPESRKTLVLIFIKTFMNVHRGPIKNVPLCFCPYLRQ